MRQLFYSLILCLLATAAVRAQSIAGDWEGTLKVGPAELRLVLHVKPAEKGAWQATIDSVDQNVMDIAISTVQFNDGTLKLDLPTIEASYLGRLSEDGKTISGTWAQGSTALPLDFTRADRSKDKKRTPKPSDIDGQWEGALETGAQTLRLVLHIASYEDGMTAKLDSPDQKLTGLPVTTIEREDAELKFEMKQLAGSFAGTIEKDLKTISGEWSQGAATLPLTLKRKGAPPAAKKSGQ